MAESPKTVPSQQKPAVGIRPFGGFRPVIARPISVLPGQVSEQTEVKSNPISAPPTPTPTNKPTVPAAPQAVAPTSAFANYGQRRFGQVASGQTQIRPALSDKIKSIEPPAQQVPYKPGSRFPETGAMVPSDVAEAMQRALLEFKERYGDIDEFVCDGLGITLSRLNEILSAEQIDAIALGVAAALEGRGFIVGDMTGFGKGRIIVAISVILMRKLNRPTVFSTEKAALFSDLFRDIRDTGTELEIGEPLLMNQGAKIVDMSARSGHLLFKHSPSAMSKIIQSAELPKATRLLMTTYSQFSRPGDKQRFLMSIAPNAHFLNDEAQNLVGDSAVGNTYSKALARAASSTFSSATFARHVTNLSSYSQVMPWLETFFTFTGLNPEKLPPNFRRSLAEASLLRAIADGGLIRREHDMSSMKLRMEDVAWPNNEHEEIADKLASILQHMMALSKYVQSIVDDRNEKLSSDEREVKAQWTFANFGSRMSLIGAQWEVAMMIKGAVQFTKNVLLNGQKPAIVLDSTMESMMNEVLELEEEGTDGGGLEGTPSFRDALTIVAKNLLRIKYRPGAGAKPETHYIDRSDLIHRLNLLLVEIAGFPDLPLSPLDELRHGLEDAGVELHKLGEISAPWVVGEISGRKLSLNRDGKIQSFDPGDRNSVVNQFVNGGIDILILTRAGAVGLSAHDSAAFSDHKQRHMIEIRAPRNVLERVQMWGRVFRRSQLTEPEFTALTLPLPTVIYEIASQNRKIAELSASVSGNSKSLKMAKEIADPIDAHGEMAASFLLSRDPELRSLLWMGDGLDDDDASDDLEKSDNDDFPTISKMLRRMRLLPVHRQRGVFEDFWIIRDDMLRTFPDEPSRLDGVWEVKSEFPLDPAPRPGRPPLKAIRIRGERHVQPITEDRLQDMLVVGESRYRDLSPMVRSDRLNFLARIKSRDMPECPNLATALAASGDNPVLKADKAITQMLALMQVIKTGVMITMPPGDNGRPVLGIVTETHCKNAAEPCLPQNHIINIATPGETTLRRISFDTIISKPDLYKVSINPISYKTVMDEFRAAKPGIVEVSRIMLTGEPVEEAFGSVRLGGGSRVSYQTVGPHGTATWNTGILVPKHLEKEVAKLSVAVTNPDAVINVLRLREPNSFLTSSGIANRNIFQFGPVFQRDYGGRIVHMVAMVTSSHKIGSIIEEAMKDSVPSFKIRRSSDLIEMSVKTSDAKQTLEILRQMGIRLHADYKHRSLILGTAEVPPQVPVSANEPSARAQRM